MEGELKEIVNQPKE
jgi:hypothetical protein